MRLLMLMNAPGDGLIYIMVPELDFIAFDADLKLLLIRPTLQ